MDDHSSLDYRHALADEALRGAVARCPNSETARERAREVGKKPDEQKDQFGLYRDAVRELCPRNTLSQLFEKTLAETPAILFWDHASFIKPEEAVLDLFYSAAHKFGAKDFEIDKSPSREKSARGHELFTPGELHYALEYMGRLRPDIFLGINLFIGTVHLFAEEGVRRASSADLRIDQNHTEIFGALKPWLTGGFGKIAREIKIEPSDLPPLAAALCVFDRARNPMNRAITHPEPQHMVDALQWAFNAGFFKRGLKSKGCPAAVHVVQLLTMPLFRGTEQEAPAVACFIRKAAQLIATDEAWRGKALQVSKALLRAVSFERDKSNGSYTHYKKTPSARALARATKRLGHAPHLFIAPKQMIALG